MTPHELNLAAEAHNDEIWDEYTRAANLACAQINVHIPKNKPRVTVRKLIGRRNKSGTSYSIDPAMFRKPDGTNDLVALTEHLKKLKEG